MLLQVRALTCNIMGFLSEDWIHDASSYLKQKITHIRPGEHLVFEKEIKQLLSDFIPKIPFLQRCLPYLLFVLAPLYHHQLLGFPLVLEHPVKKKNTILLRLLYSKSNHELKRNKCCGPNSSHKKKRYWQVCIYAVQWWNNKW